jgi:hypothetical protein
LHDAVWTEFGALFPDKRSLELVCAHVPNAAHWTIIDFVCIMIKDQFVSRSDMWRLKKNFIGK